MFVCRNGPQAFQLNPTNGDWKEARDSRGTGIFETGPPEGEVLQSRQGHSEFGDTIVVQLGGALTSFAFVMAGVRHV